MTLADSLGGICAFLNLPDTTEDDRGRLVALTTQTQAA
jgi:hypothetical protein